MENIAVVVDVMGGDHGPDKIIEGCLTAAREVPHADIVLLGPEDLLKSKLANHNHPVNIKIEHAPDVIHMDEEPAWAVRNKAEATIVVGSKMIKEGKAQAIISPGNTGAVMAAGLLIIGRIKGISRPGIAVRFPIQNKDVYLLDAGANADCKPENLLEFAIMANSYLKSVVKNNNPSVGLLSIGEEKTKGNELIKSAYPLLENSGLNFYGNVEGRDIAAGTTDIVVCDGYTGNVVLKLSEGLVKAVFEEFKAAAKSSLLGKVGGLLLKPGLRKLKRRLDPDEYGGALLLGVKGVCIICHGSSSARAIHNAVVLAVHAVEGGVVAKIQEDMKGKAVINA